MITDILFDLGNVLVPIDWDRAYARLLPCLPHGMAELLRSDRTAFENIIEEACAALETGKLGFGDFYRTISGTLGLEIDEQRFHYIWCDIFDVDRDIVAMGRWMARRYGTWLLSNTSEAHYRWIVETFPEIVFYEGAALSYDLGVMKPTAEFFAEALRRFDIDPSHAVFIDDLEENVEGAIRVGINGIVYKGRAQLVRDLRKIDVMVPDGME